jgi:hypothetical protein
VRISEVTPVRILAAYLTRLVAWLMLPGAVVGLVLAQEPGAQRWFAHATDHFDIFYQSPQRDHVDAVAREAERAYARISLALGHQLAEKVPLILVAADRDLPHNVAEGRALVIASRAPERDHLLLSVETFEKRPVSRLAHELTHWFVFELLPHADRDAPWISEALPDHQSGEWQPSDLEKIRDALAHGSVPAVEELSASDRHWGHAVLDFVAAEYGAQGIRRYLSALRRRPTTSSEAIRAAFEVTADQFNVAFQTYLRTQLGDR